MPLVRIPTTAEWSDWHSSEERQCGKCTACCKWLGIEELKKYTGEKCKHLRNPIYGSKRCGIYSHRPTACSEYLCMWRIGWGPDYMRPHESGILITGYQSEVDANKVSFTVNIFDQEKAKGKETDVVAALFTSDMTDEVRLINIQTRKALLFKNGFVYDCKLIPGVGYESLNFEAIEIPISRYEQQKL